MNSITLQRPFVWNERRILIEDRVLYVPALCDTSGFVFPGWDDTRIFGNTNPVHIEYCSGNGDWIAGKALANPDINWVAVEQKFPRTRKIWAKVKKHNLSNLFIVCGEGHITTKLYFPCNSVKVVYINFPDPWPKTRHAKNRIIQSDFMSEISRIMETKGHFVFVTDDASYSEWTTKIVLREPDFVASYPDPFYTTDESDYGYSYFGQLWRQKGKTIRHHKFQKIL